MVLPMLICRNGAAEIEFCKAAFGAIETSRRTDADGAIVHASLAIGSAMLMVHGEVGHLASRAPQLDGSSSVVICLYVDDADAVIERARVAGANILLPPADYPWGDRTGRILDPAGHVWNISARRRETNGAAAPSK
jgi:PhnB protein